MDEALEFHEYMYEDEPTEDLDMAVMRKTIHNTTIQDLKEELLEAVTERREDVLRVAVDIFNKVQEKAIHTRRFNQLNDLDEDTVDINSINESLHLCEKLLQDSRSPLLSALQTLA